MRADRLNHLADEQIIELLPAALATKAELLGGSDVAADYLAVHPRQPINRAQPLAVQPQAQHLSIMRNSA